MVSSKRIFEGIDIKDKVILDVGCGSGQLLIEALQNNAKYSVGIDPKLEYDTTVQGGVRLYKLTIQDFNMPQELFDIIVLKDSINHVDEEACIFLSNDVFELKAQDAADKYGLIFEKLYYGLKHGGKLIITDCSSRNLFADFKMTNPFCPSIEWHKHQIPEVWISLLKECGFSNPKVNWLVPNELKWLGFILKRKFIAYLFLSHFRLVMEK